MHSSPVLEQLLQMGWVCSLGFSDAPLSLGGTSYLVALNLASPAGMTAIACPIPRDLSGSWSTTGRLAWIGRGGQWPAVPRVHGIIRPLKYRSLAWIHLAIGSTGRRLGVAFIKMTFGRLLARNKLQALSIDLPLIG